MKMPTQLWNAGDLQFPGDSVHYGHIEEDRFLTWRNQLSPLPVVTRALVFPGLMDLLKHGRGTP